MSVKIRVIIAVLVIIGAVVWSFNTIRQRNYSGAKIAFEIGSGYVVVNNPGKEAIPIQLRTNGRSTSFTVQSTELDLRENSKRQGTGRNAYQLVSLELPPGQAKIDVIRGGEVQLISLSSQRIEAVVTPLEAGNVQTVLIFTGLVILGALYYISGTLEHRWIGALRRKLFRHPGDLTPTV